jgi:asparagine synthase (glutamine-hydrolysing)
LYQATAAAGIKVLLEGQGADELFGGYDHFIAHQPFAVARGWATLRNYLLAIRQRSRIARSIYYGLDTFFPFLSAPARATVELPDLTPTVHEALVDAQQTSILPGLLQYSDRLAMRWGVEVRLPFLDYRLVELVNALPDAFKLRGRETKRILRSAYASDLPESVVERPKIGFGSPTTTIIRDHREQLVATFVLRGHFANSALFRSGWSSKLRGTFMHTLPNSDRVLWRFIVIEEWMKQFGVEIAT